jgi:hypothetical protein
MSRLVIKEHRPLKPLLYFAGSVLLFVLALVAMVDYAEWRFLLGTMSLAGEQQKAIADNLTLRKDNQRLRDEVERLRRSAAVDAEARRNAQLMIGELEQQVRETRRAIGFYRDVLDASVPGQLPAIAGARVVRSATKGQYRLSVIVSHTTRNAKNGLAAKLTGRLRAGPGSKPSELALADVVANPEELAFELKTFALLELELRLPDDFTPETLELSLKQPKGKTEKARTYPWMELMR